jgi:hypothetical protein
VKIKNWHKFQHFKDRRPPWVKLYRDLLDDPDWHALDPAASKVLVMLWLIASENDGTLPDARKLSFRLRMKENALIQLLNGLSHWLEQDDITTISDRYQVDAPETEGERETETQEKTETDFRSKRPDEFEEFWKACPKRQGSNPKALAKKKFAAVVKSGGDPQAIILAARQWASSDRDKIGTPYLPQVSTWLGQQRFDDYRPPPTAGPLIAPAGLPSDEELRKKYGQRDNSIPTEAKTANGHGIGADHTEELRCEGVEIRPGFRAF